MVGGGRPDRAFLVRSAAPLPTRSLHSVSPSLICSHRSSHSHSPSSAVAPFPVGPRSSPPAVSLARTQRQAHHETHLQLGKPLRTLNHHDKPLCGRNGSPEFVDHRWNAQPRESIPFSPSFSPRFRAHLVRGDLAKLMRVFSLAILDPRWLVTGEHRHQAPPFAIHATTDLPEPSLGAHHVRLVKEGHRNWPCHWRPH